jgi:hypothetical protein
MSDLIGPFQRCPDRDDTAHRLGNEGRRLIDVGYDVPNKVIKVVDVQGRRLLAEPWISKDHLLGVNR